jgi:hypothetical protein
LVQPVFPPENECIQVLYIRACVKETGASKLFTANITADDPFEMAGKFGDFSLDDVIEYAKTHEDAKGVLTVQKEADQIYSGWKEKLG